MERSGDKILDVTQLLDAVRGGQAQAVEQLIQKVYGELKEIAGRHLRRDRPDHTFDATDLVHEAYFKLLGRTDVSWDDRAHFFGAAARAMRQILVDHARARNAKPLSWARIRESHCHPPKSFR